MTERFPFTQITANSYLCLLLKDLSQKTLRNGWLKAQRDEYEGELDTLQIQISAD